ncbi:cytokinesis regulator, partial [Rhizoctonia solani]
MSATVPAPAPSFVITRTEEWPEADFDLPDDQETFAIDNEGDEQADPGNRIKGSRPSLSGAGAVAKLGGAPVEDEDWDAEFEDAPIKSATASSANSSTSHFTGKITRLGSIEPRKTKENVEDWSDDGDLELPEPSHTNFTLARAPLPQPNVLDTEDAGDVSTIKIAKHNFPSVAKKSSTKPVEEDDFEADFALPAEMSNLSLRILTPQTSSLSLRKSSTLVEGNGPWGELTTSTSTYSDTSSLLSLYPPDASPSTSSASQLGTETDPSDGDFAIYEDEDEAFEGLILPEGLAGKNLAKHLETKKQIVPAQIAAENDAKGSLTSQSRRTANETEDFESGLVIGDEDISITRLRLRRMANPAEYRSKSVPLPRTGSGSYRPSSSSRLRPESVMEVLSASKVPTISRSRSPSSVSQRSLSKKDSRSSLVSPTNFSSLRPSSVRASSSSHASPSTANLLSIPSPSSISGIAPRTAPLKHQKSLGRLQLSSTSSSTSTTLGVKLGRKASLASLADPSSSITPSSTLSTRPSGFGAPTASSKARQKPEPRDEADKKSSGRPTTPSAGSVNSASLRLTMPTSSSRQKIRPSISSVFPSPIATAPADRATSPQPNPRRTPTSPRRIRTRSGASNGGTPSSSISSMASATAPKVMRKPKRIQAFSDGTELDAFDDLPEDTEKERKFRVQPAGRGNVSSSRGEKGSSASTTSGGTLGRKAGGTLRRPPSSASSHGSVDPPKSTGKQSLRHKPRVDFPVKVAIPEPTPRRKKPTVTAIGGPRKKPMLIRNLGGAGTAKTVGDMKWNPKTLRWEGNEQVLKEFDAHAAPSRPALITHLTGSSIGGLMSPTGSMLASGARIVGNMLFDPVRMCWISRLPPEEEEPDVFAGLADDEGDWEDKAGTIRANTGGTNATDDGKDWKGSVRSTDSMREMTMSPARSHTRSMSESESEAGDTPSARGTRRGGRQSFGGQSVHEEVPGVDDALVAACRAAEERHKQEMKGWYIRSRSRSRSVKSSTEAEEAPVRTHLFDIRALATRKY